MHSTAKYEAAAIETCSVDMFSSDQFPWTPGAAALQPIMISDAHSNTISALSANKPRAAARAVNTMCDFVLGDISGAGLRGATCRALEGERARHRGTLMYAVQWTVDSEQSYHAESKQNKKDTQYSTHAAKSNDEHDAAASCDHAAGLGRCSTRGKCSKWEAAARSPQVDAVCSTAQH
jgi:hypothetical protein